MQDVIVFGSGQIAELADFYFRNDSELRVRAFTVDGEYLKQTTFNGKPVVAMEQVAQEFPPDRHVAFVAVSYSRLNALRSEKASALRNMGYTLASYVSSRATIFSGTTPGPNAFILENNTIQPFVRIGANVTLWSGNHIGHHSVIEDDVFIASQIVISGNCRIKRRTFIGVNAAIRDGVTIGERSVIGMGACITADCDDETVFPSPVTEPARVKSSRLRHL